MEWEGIIQIPPSVSRCDCLYAKPSSRHWIYIMSKTGKNSAPHVTYNQEKILVNFSDLAISLWLGNTMSGKFFTESTSKNSKITRKLGPT